MNSTNIIATPLQDKINTLVAKILAKIKEDGYCRLSTCDHKNWDVLEHHAVHQLYMNGIPEIYINYQINYGVHDWYFSYAKIEFNS